MPISGIMVVAVLSVSNLSVATPTNGVTMRIVESVECLEARKKFENSQQRLLDTEKRIEKSVNEKDFISMKMLLALLKVHSKLELMDDIMVGRECRAQP